MWVKVVEGGWNDLIEQLRDGVLDLVVGAIRSCGIEDLQQIPLFEDGIVVLAGRDHPLARKKSPSLAELSNYPWVVEAPNSPLRTQWERLFAGHDLPPCPIECGSIMITINVLEQGPYLTLLSPSQVTLPLAVGRLVALDVKHEDSARVLGITHRRNWNPTTVQRHFISVLRSLRPSLTLEADTERRAAEA